MRFVPDFIVQIFTKESYLYKELSNLLGFTPSNIALYEMALCHRSNSRSTTENNERLEFLGDAILGAIIGEFLFAKYPMQPEGFLTEMRSKIVNRKTLNDIAKKMGLKALVKFNENDSLLHNSSIHGNALEALIGAIYLDKGYIKTKKFVKKRILLPYIQIEDIENTEANVKNKLIGWANRNGKKIEFALINETIKNSKKVFEIAVKIDEQIIASSGASSKKEAGKMAAIQAMKMLEIE